MDDVGSDAARSEGDNRSQRSGLNKSEEGASEPDTVLSSDESKLNMSCRNAAAADSSGGSHVHWSDSKREEDEKRKKQLARHKRKLIQSRQAAFSLQVPDHYPNSPLCPANPKHVSGGTGVCVVSTSRASDILSWRLLIRVTSTMAESRIIPKRSSRLLLSWACSSPSRRIDSQLRLRLMNRTPPYGSPLM